VRALLESFLRFLVAMRRALDGEALDASRKGDGPGDARAGAFDGVGDFARRLVYDALVIGLEPNAYALSIHTKNNCLLNFFLKTPLPYRGKRTRNLPDTSANAISFLRFFGSIQTAGTQIARIDTGFGHAGGEHQSRSVALLSMEVLFIGANYQAAKPINCSVLARRAANNAVITRRPLSVTA